MGGIAGCSPHDRRAAGPQAPTPPRSAPGPGAVAAGPPPPTGPVRPRRARRRPCAGPRRPTSGAGRRRHGGRRPRAPRPTAVLRSPRSGRPRRRRSTTRTSGRPRAPRGRPRSRRSPGAVAPALGAIRLAYPRSPYLIRMPYRSVGSLVSSWRGTDERSAGHTYEGARGVVRGAGGGVMRRRRHAPQAWSISTYEQTPGRYGTPAGGVRRDVGAGHASAPGRAGTPVSSRPRASCCPVARGRPACHLP